MTSRLKLEAAHAAIETLDETWDSDSLGYRLPVDPIKIANAYGIAVYEDDFPSRISGAIVSTEEKGAIILLNKNDVNQRRRFTCAHEIGHYYKRVLAGDSDDRSFKFIDLRGTLSSEGTDDDEIFANEFAASLLMPKEQVEAMRPKYSLSQLAEEFKVSRDAMTFRLRNLGLSAS